MPIVILTGLFSACKPAANPSPVAPTIPTTPTISTTPPLSPQADFKPIAAKVTLPITIDYHVKEGLLKDLLYQATFSFDTQNRLTAITEEQSDYPKSNAAWVWFSYPTNRLTRINLRPIGSNLDALSPARSTNLLSLT